MRKYPIFIMALLLLLTFTGCGSQSPSGGIAGKTYVYEKEGFGGDFTVTLNSDGTFQYYEGPLSSYIGIGTWEAKGNTLLLCEDKDVCHGFQNSFRIDGDSLLFQEEDSDNFLYIKVSGQEKFLAVTE